MKTTSKWKRPQNENDLKIEDALKNKYDLKNEDDLKMKTTSKMKMEDDLWLDTPFYGGQPIMEGSLKWEMTVDERWPFVKVT